MKKNKNYFSLSKLLKKPEMYDLINIEAIKRNVGPLNYIYSNKSFNKSKLKENKNEKKNIKFQIGNMSNKINFFSKQSHNNLHLIDKIKRENEPLISEVKEEVKNCNLFNNNANELFHDLIKKYIKKGYKNPKLKSSQNLFKINPLLMEEKYEIDEYYRKEASIQKEEISDWNLFLEKNWVYLNKINDAYIEAKKNENPFFSKKKEIYKRNYPININTNINTEYNNELPSIEKLINDIKKTKNLIKLQDKEHENSKKNQNSQLNLMNNLNKAVINKLNKKKYKYNSLSLNKKNSKQNKFLNASIYDNKIKNMKENILFKNYIKNGLIKRPFDLITSLKRQKIKKEIQKENSLTETLYNKLSKNDYDSFNEIENDLLNYSKSKNKEIKPLKKSNINSFMNSQMKYYKTVTQKMNHKEHKKILNNLGFPITEYKRSAEKLESIDNILGNLEKEYESRKKRYQFGIPFKHKI